MKDITDKQIQVLEYLQRFSQQFGYMPTTRDISTHFKFSSQTSAVHHLNALVLKGYISRAEGKSRAIRIIKSLVNETNVS